MMEKVYGITGTNGFAGRNLYDYLEKQGKNVIALCNRKPDYKSNYRICDVNNSDSLKKTFDVITHLFHLAAFNEIPKVIANPLHAIRTNVLGTMNVIEACKAVGVKRMLYCSTCHIYWSSNNAITETTKPNPIDLYSITKYVGELAARNSKMNVVVTRAFNHYGPHQKPTFLIPNAIKKLQQKEAVFQSPDASRDYTHVGDIVRGYLRAMENGLNGEIYQFASGKERTVKSVVEDIKRLMGSSCKLTWEGGRKVDFQQYGSYEKARQELGWKPEIGWEEGLKETIAFYLDLNAG